MEREGEEKELDGYSKSQQVSYQQHNPEYVTTVMKQAIDDMQKTNKVHMKEVIEENNAAVKQKHGAALEEMKRSYNGYNKHEAFKEKEDSGYNYNSYHGGGGAVQKHGYKYEEEEKSAVDGYGGYHGGAGVQNRRGVYGKAAGGAAGYVASHYGGGDIHKYDYQKDKYGEANDALGYHGYVRGGVQQHSYSYGGGVQAYGAAVYKQKEAGYGSAAKHQEHGFKQEMNGKAGGSYHYAYDYESESERDSDDESDCEEEFGHQYTHGGGYGAYKLSKETQNSGSVEVYKREEKRRGGVRRYDDLYKAADTHEGKGYAAAGARWATQRKNRLFF